MKLSKKLLYTSLIMVFLVSMTMLNAVSASPETHFWVDPPFIVETPTGKFDININIADAPPTYSWEIHLSWDPVRLELLNVAEGDWLHRWTPNPFPPPPAFPTYDTNLAKTPLDEANIEGEIIIACTLVAALPQSAWASGDGILVSLEFLVQKVAGIHIDLFDTRLWDHMDASGYPAATSYSNKDCQVEGTAAFYAGLSEWKVKVNGAAGGTTTVGTENLLEAHVTNTGTFDANVQTFFEIRDSAGYWLATVPSGIVLLTSGGSTTLSTTWTADLQGVYYVTAYAFYGELGADIPGGISRSLRLRAIAS